MEKDLFAKHLEAMKIVRENYSRSTYEKVIRLFNVESNHNYIVETVYDFLQNKNVTESELLQLIKELTQAS